jgi:hypothetical protein
MDSLYLGARSAFPERNVASVKLSIDVVLDFGTVSSWLLSCRPS